MLSERKFIYTNIKKSEVYNCFIIKEKISGVIIVLNSGKIIFL